MNEIVSRRTARSKTYDLGDGGRRLVCGGDIAHHQQDGLWVPTSSTWGEDSSEFATGQHPCTIASPKTFAQPLLFGHGGDIVTVRPLGYTKPPAGVSQESDNCVLYEQAWDGIDARRYLTPEGLKSTYTITSEEGQRELRFKCTGDVMKFHKAPWYIDGGLEPVFVPFMYEDGELVYDFTSVPVGAVVDPTLSITADSSDGYLVSSHSNWYTLWNQSSAGGGSNDSSDTYLSCYATVVDGPLYVLARTLVPFDTSGVPADVTLDSASLRLTAYSRNADGQKIHVVTTDITSVSDFYNYDHSHWGTSSYGYFPEGVDLDTPTSFDIDPSIIDAGAMTYLGLRASNDFDNEVPTIKRTYGLRPSTYEVVAHRPQLTVEYTEASETSLPIHLFRHRSLGLERMV